jgi:hypothetical protein
MCGVAPQILVLDVENYLSTLDKGQNLWDEGTHLWRLRCAVRTGHGCRPSERGWELKLG